MKQNILYETNNTVVTTTTIMQNDGGVYQIKNITDMQLEDDESFNKMYADDLKTSRFSNLIKSGGLILLGLIISAYSIGFGIFILVIGGLWFLFSYIKKIEQKPTTYELKIYFNNGKKLTLSSSSKDVILELRNAIATAMENY